MPVQEDAHSLRCRAVSADILRFTQWDDFLSNLLLGALTLRMVRLSMAIQKSDVVAGQTCRGRKTPRSAG